MKNHKLILTLMSLDKSELNAFIRRASNPFFNKKTEVLVLLKYLKKQYPEFEEKRIKREKLFSLFSKEKEKNNRFFDDLVYSTTKLLEDFLIDQSLKQNPVLHSKLLMEAYKKRNLSQMGMKVLDKFKKNKLQEDYSLNISMFSYDLELNSFLMEEVDFSETYINKMYDINKSLEENYWLLKLFINDEINNSKEVFSTLTNIIDENEEELLNHKMKKLDHFSLKIFHFLNFPNKKFSYDEIKSLYLKHIHSLDHMLNGKVINSLINYCKKQYGATQDGLYIKEWFFWYQKGVEIRALYLFDKLNDTSYLNIVHLGLVLKEFEWVEKFINNNFNAINDQQLYDLSLGMYYYAINEFDKALNILIAVEFGHIHKNLNARSIIAKIYYQSEEFELLENHLNAFEKYLRRQKEIAQALREANLNFVFSCRKLMKIKYDPKTKASLLNDLEKKPIAYKSWFIEQV